MLTSITVWMNQFFRVFRYCLLLRLAHAVFMYMQRSRALILSSLFGNTHTLNFWCNRISPSITQFCFTDHCKPLCLVQFRIPQLSLKSVYQIRVPCFPAVQQMQSYKIWFAFETSKVLMDFLVRLFLSVHPPVKWEGILEAVNRLPVGVAER